MIFKIRIPQLNLNLTVRLGLNFDSGNCVATPTARLSQVSNALLVCGLCTYVRMQGTFNQQEGGGYTYKTCPQYRKFATQVLGPWG